MAINYPKIILLNLVAAIMIYIFFYNDTDNSIRGIVSLGFIVSLFFKENLSSRFLKSMIVNLLFFFLLFALIDYLGSVINIMVKGNSDNLVSVLNSIGLSFGFTHFYLFGYFAGIIPQGIMERIEKRKKKSA